MSTSNNSNDQCGNSGEMKSNKKECTSCEQTDVNNITEGIDCVVIQDDVSICANCGKEGNDVTNICNKCKMVKYCNAACKKKHRHKHKKQCEEHTRQVAELHDIELFKEPPSLYGDCPICFLRMPSLYTGYKYQSCCGKVICSGCFHAPVYDNQGNKVTERVCSFCRTPHPDIEEETVKRTTKRAESNDSHAMHNLGYFYRDGTCGYPQDYTKALELWHRAAELGHTEAYCNIGYTYEQGRGVEVDKKKANHYYELAAMTGSAEARYNLGSRERLAGNFERAMKHYMIAVKDGDNDSLTQIQLFYSNGQASKDDYTKALQSYQSYLGEIKSKQRDEAAAAREEYRYY